MRGIDGVTILTLLIAAWAAYGLLRHASRARAREAGGKAHEQEVQATLWARPVVPSMTVRPLRPLRAAEPGEGRTPGTSTQVASYNTWHESAECDPKVLGFRGYDRTSEQDVTRNNPLIAERLRAIQRGEWPGAISDGGDSDGNK